MKKNVLDVCERRSNNSVYFDNIFSSNQLLLDLDKKGFLTTGTMRNDHVMKCH